MSKKLNKEARRFKYTPTTQLPKLGQIKTEWDLAALYYTSEKDPQIEKDIQKTEKRYRAFAKKYANADFTATASALLAALEEYQTLSALPEAGRAGRYFAFRSVINTKDSVAQKQEALLRKRMRKLQDQMLFFVLRIGKIPAQKQKQFLKDETLRPFHYFLKRVFIEAKHHLSEAEEKIINLKSNQSSGMWADMTEKIISNKTVTFKKKVMALPEAIETLDSLESAKDKEALWQLITSEMEVIGEVAEHEFNAIITDARTEDELRGYKKPYSATALGYQDTEKSIESLLSAVSSEGFKLSRKFYKLKAAYHGVPQLNYVQKYDSIGEAPHIPFSEAVEICRDVFYGLHQEYGAIFDRMLTLGQIDVYPRAGKRGGAFMSNAVGQPTQVLLNHTNTFKSLETLAHEMGHAIHAERSKAQPALYEGHSITTAETASTLFENLLFDAVYDQASAESKPILLHDRITRDIATIQRQIAFFNCELEIHETIAHEGAMTNEELRNCMYKHLRSYLGDAVKLEPKDGYSYVYIPHLRYGFYVYTYTFGILMSTIMANQYKADRSYIEQIDRFLTAGESDTVANIFKLIGINTNKPDTFSEALKNHAADINTFTALVKAKK